MAVPAHVDSLPVMADQLPAPRADWLLAALDESSDLVVVMAEDFTINYVSSACRRLVGFDPGDAIGRSMTEFLHPDDLERAAEVVALAGEDRFDRVTPMTPTLYRIRHAEGHWVPLEINATRARDGSSDLLAVIRESGDQVHDDRLLELVIDGAPFDDQLDVVLDFGFWRYPSEGYVLIWHDDGSRLARGVGVHDPRLAAREPVDGATPWDVAMATGERVVVSDLDHDAVVAPELAARARDEGFDAVLAVPVDDPAHPGGACIVVWSTPDGPSVAGQRYPMQKMSRALALTLQWRAHRRALEHAANVDMLTKVSTRQRFFEVAQQLLEDDARAVLYIDLDGFKAVNDRHGHSAGDFVLAITAKRLVEAIGAGALIGRLGGDEFAVLLPPGSTVTDTEACADRVVRAAAEPVDLSDTRVQIGASVGITMRSADEDLDEVLERADRGLLEAKAAGRNGWHFTP